MRNKSLTLCLLFATAFLMAPTCTVDAQSDDAYEQMMMGNDGMNQSQQGGANPNAVWECSSCGTNHKGDQKSCPGCGAIFTESEKKPGANDDYATGDDDKESKKEKEERLRKQGMFFGFLVWGMRIVFFMVDGFIITLIIHLISQASKRKKKRLEAEQAFQQAAFANQTGPKLPGAVFESRSKNH